MQEHGAEPDRGAVHKNKLARYRDRTFLLERLMHAERFAAAIFGWRDAIGNAADAVIKQWRIDEARPDVEGLNQIARELAETPGFVSVYDQVVLSAQQPVIKVDDATHEFRRKNANAAIVEQVDAGRRTVSVKD